MPEGYCTDLDLFGFFLRPLGTLTARQPTFDHNIHEHVKARQPFRSYQVINISVFIIITYVSVGVPTCLISISLHPFSHEY